MDEFFKLSRRYGQDSKYLLWNEGNSSVKIKDNMIISQTGSSLGMTPLDESLETKDSHSFITMVRKDLEELVSSLTGKEDKSEVKRKIAGARRDFSDGRMPSSEVLLHASLPYTYVLHTHPPMVNGMTAGKEGKKHCAELFGDRAVWIDFYVDHYELAKACYQSVKEYTQRTGSAPKIIFLDNHGVVVNANSLEEINELMEDVLSTIEKVAGKNFEFTPAQEDLKAVCDISPTLRMLDMGENLVAGNIVFAVNKELLDIMENPKELEAFSSPFTEMQYIYTGGNPLLINKAEDIEAGFKEYQKSHGGKAPRIVLVNGVGLFALGKNMALATASRDFFLGALTVYHYAKAFGGAEGRLELTTLTHSLNFLPRRMDGRIAIVTGGAQGFGEGIATGLAKAGGNVTIADLNLEGAQLLANRLNDSYGRGTAVAVKVDVSNEESVENMVQRTVEAFGGLDILVANAGIAIAGDITEMTREKLDLVTSINYTGYFLCVKYATVPMKIQHKYNPEYWMDVIEINSKSGLVGSNKNFAYAGSKFGGIGLTQSFALELVESCVKVNAICPGNLLDGPLWSDPEKGLFKQYFEAGKVPGATSVADVRKHYENQVPMKRGCTLDDVVTAVCYLVDQKYETGQALPVAGGQVMLK